MGFRHFSWNSIGSGCKYQLYKRYIEERQTTTKPAMIRGLMQEAGPTAIVSGILSGVSGSDPESAIRKVYEDNLSILEGEQVEHLESLIMKMTDLSVRSVNDMLDKGITPVSLQKKYSYKIEGIEYPLIGYSDMTGTTREGRVVILDWKSGDKAPSQLKLKAWKQQLGLYAMAEMAEADTADLPVVVNQVFTILKTKERVEWFEQDINAEDLSTVIMKANDLQLCIEMDYWPRNRDSPLCSDRWCDFYSECHMETLIPVSKISEQINPI